MTRRFWLAAGAFALAAFGAVAADFPRPRAYHDGVNVGEYAARAVVAGAPARWDGQNLIGRGGAVYSPPPWFINGFPDAEMTGVLTGAGGNLESIARIARQARAEAGWRKLHFLAFDLPRAGGDLTARQNTLRALVEAANLPQLRAARWRAFADADALRRALKENKDGGGFILQRIAAAADADDDADLLLALPYETGVAAVVAARPGKGQYEGMMGSVEVSSAVAGVFLIGTGFNIAERRAPPTAGRLLEYKYNGLTETGKPKNPVYLRLLPPREQKIGGWLRANHLMWFFLALMSALAALDALTHRRGGRRWNFKSAIVSTGMLGTFVGIWWGLYNFDTDNIAAGVPALLAGLKLSFITSIAGIALSTLLSVAQTVAGAGDE